MVGIELSHYRILEELGRGGMGIVYKAHDTKLDRTVAIKVMPSAAVATEDDRARFYREAKAAAKLHHPNIAGVFEIDEAVPGDAPHETLPSAFIAMEFVDGEALSEMIKRGPVKLESAVSITRQIALALESAHENNIVHRDIKPQNVIITKKGDAKVLDFGLALTAASTKLTKMGWTLGTVAYMSPEQARGDLVDYRTDIWSLGATLYEMIAGRHPFAGDYEQAVVYSILNEDPEPLTSVRSGVPMGLEWIVDKMLAKKADHRYQSIADLIVDLSTVNLNALGQSRLTSTYSANRSAGASRHRNERAITPWMLIGAILAAAFLSALAARQLFPVVAGNEPAFVKLPLMVEGVEYISYPNFSAERSSIFFLGTDSLGTTRYYEKNLRTLLMSAITGPVTGRFSYPEESPSGRHLVLTFDGAMQLKAQPDGAWTQLYVDGLYPTWLDDRRILFVESSYGGIHVFDIETSQVTAIIVPDTSDSADYRRFVYDVIPEKNAAIVGHEYQGTTDRPADLYWMDLSDGSETHLWSGGINAIVLGDSHISYQTGDNDAARYVQPFDIEQRKLTGERMQILPEEIDWYRVSVTRFGDVLVAETRGCAATEVIKLSSSDSVPENRRLLDDGCYHQFDLSADGFTEVAVRRERPSALQSRLEIHDWRNRRMRVIDEHDMLLTEPAFAHDGEHLFAVSDETATTPSIFRVRMDGIGRPVRVIEDGHSPDVSFDGSTMVFRRRNGEDSDVWVFYVATGNEKLLIPGTNSLGRPSISPDGQFVVYARDRESELWIAEIASGITRSIPVGYSRLVWGHDSGSLYTLSNGELLRLNVRLKNGAIVMDEWDPVAGVDASNWSGIQIDENGEFYYGRILDRTESKGFARLEWWQNYYTQLEGFVPSRSRN